MPHRQSPCFVLRTYPLAETAKGVVLFSEEEGKIKGWAQGARRPNSRFGSSLDLGNEVMLGWQDRQDREWVRLRHCELLTSALPLMRSPVSAAALHHQVRLVDLFAPDREPGPHLYRLLGACLRALRDDGPALLVTAYFEAWLLRLSGLYPRPSRCRCGAGFDRCGAVFWAAGPVYRCPDCAPGENGEPTARISPNAVRLLAAFWTSPPGTLKAGPAARELFRLHGCLTEAAAGRRLRTRAALVTVLKRLAPGEPLPHPPPAEAVPGAADGEARRARARSPVSALRARQRPSASPR